jgi:hypothetical protein
MKTLYAILLSAVLFGCGGGSGGPGAPVGSNDSGTFVASTPDPLDPILGRWVLLGTYCGAAFTPAGSTQVMEVTATRVYNEVMTACGTQSRIQEYQFYYDWFQMSTQLIKSYQNGLCPVTLSPVLNAPVTLRTYSIAGDELTVNTGLCAGGQQGSIVYEAE